MAVGRNEAGGVSAYLDIVHQAEQRQHLRHAGCLAFHMLQDQKFDNASRQFIGDLVGQLRQIGRNGSEFGAHDRYEITDRVHGLDDVGDRLSASGDDRCDGRQIVGIEEQEIAGMSLELFVITFDKDKMTLRVPTAKVDAMRKLSEASVVEKAMHTLKGRARVKRTMWSRRAQEYENKINSGDLIFIAEVVRDLYRSESQPEQSYSERQLYEAALDRMARELAAVEKLDERGTVQRITDVLSKSAKGRRQAEEDKAEAEALSEDGDSGDGAAAA